MSKKVIRQMLVDIKSVDEKSNTIEAVFSTADEDRHGQIVFQNWDLKMFKKNPVILNSHNYGDATEVIGKALKIGVKDGQLEGKIQFAVDENPKAKIIYDLFVGKYLNAFSIGCIAKEFDDKWNILKAELLEVSAVSVPANALALAKSAGIDVDLLMKKEVAKKDEEEAPEEIEEDDEDEEEDDDLMEDHVVTEEDIKNNPSLTDDGIEVGDTIRIPKQEPKDDDLEKEDEDDEEKPEGEEEAPAEEEPEAQPEEEKPEEEPEPIKESVSSIDVITQSLKTLASEIKVVTLERTQSEEVRANAKRLLNSVIRSLIKEKGKL